MCADTVTVQLKTIAQSWSASEASGSGRLPEMSPSQGFGGTGE